MALQVVDLVEIVKEHAELFLDKEQKKQADLENPIINWDFLYVTHGPTQYTNIKSPKPTSHVLFTANFTNDTPSPQTYALRTERRTKSSCTVSFSKTFTYGASLNIKLTPPNPVIEASTGFKSEVTKQKGISDTFEQELSWSVDNKVEVPAGYQTKAELVIKEDDFTGNFTVESTFEGTIVVNYENKKKEHVATITDSAKNFLHKKTGFKEDNQGRPVFMAEGECKCRFGIEQNVLLKERQIEKE